MLLDLPPEKEQLLKAAAQARGMTVEQWLLQLAEQFGPSAAPWESKQSSRDAFWEKEFEEWLNGIPETPQLSDEAISRASMYPDRW